MNKKLKVLMILLFSFFFIGITNTYAEEIDNNEQDNNQVENNDSNDEEDLINTDNNLSLLKVGSGSSDEKTVDEIIDGMSNEDKIAEMIMLAFRKESGVDINNDNIKEILSTYGYSGVILFSENTKDIDSTMRFVDYLQESNKDNDSRLLIGIDQEGGYVVRLGIGTENVGNMALAATGDPSYAYDSAKIIGEELDALGIDINFAPVVDIINNPDNSAIGLRSFSDDAETVATYAENYMEGLHDEGIISTLKHFPGQGDATADSHTDLCDIDKTYDELKSEELVPFKTLIDAGVEMVMADHVSYSNIEKDDEKFISTNDSNEYYLPSSLSKTMLTDKLRGDLGFDGVIITDAFDMGAITKNFDLEDATIKAINAGANIILMPFTYDSQKDQIKSYVQSLASKIGTEISEDAINDSVRRILELKKSKGLLKAYDGSDLEDRITAAKELVSSRANHDKEFEIAKKVITMIKNDDKTLPLSGDDKTIIFYEYETHFTAAVNAINMLIKEGSLKDDSNLYAYPLYGTKGFDFDRLRTLIDGFKNVIIINALYDTESLKDSDFDKMNDFIDIIHENNAKAIFISSHLPYDVARIKNADAVVLTYLANGIRFNIDDYEKELPKYGPNIIAGIYMLFTQKEDMNGVLPVNINTLDDNNEFTDEVLFQRGFGLKYKEENNNDNPINNNTDVIINPRTNDNINFYISLFEISIAGLFISLNYKKNYLNK